MFPHVKIVLNKEQKQSVSLFFNNIAVGWFVAVFVTPSFTSINLLTSSIYFVSMIVALIISLSFLREEKL